MEIILLENIINLGKIGDLVKVKNGYGRNYLLRQGKALRANKENIALVNKKKEELTEKNKQIQLKFKEIARKINNKKLNFIKESKENGDLYGSIKPKEICNAILKELNVEIIPSQINLRQEVNKLGVFKVGINLHSGVSAELSIKVVKVDS